MPDTQVIEGVCKPINELHHFRVGPGLPQIDDGRPVGILIPHALDGREYGLIIHGLFVVTHLSVYEFLGLGHIPSPKGRVQRLAISSRVEA